MDLSEYKEDLEKQEKGSPCYLRDSSPAYFDVKRINTAEYIKEIESIKKQLYGFDLSKMDSNLIMAWWLSECGCTGWSEVFSNGKLLDYSKANARSIFHNPAFYLSLNALLVQHAGNYNNYLHDEAEEDISEIKKS